LPKALPDVFREEELLQTDMPEEGGSQSLQQGLHQEHYALNDEMCHRTMPS
jgi:hypothetical protein